jgi:ABC-2 type transport system permease protein
MNLAYIYGSIVAVVLGLSSMYEEFGTKAINTLISKPVSRNAVINGKLLAATCIAILVYVLAVVVDILMILIFYGQTFANGFPAYISVLPVFFVQYLLCFMTFYLLTVLMFIVFKNASLSLFIAFMSWMFIFNILPNISFAEYLSLIFGQPQLNNLLCNVSPYSALSNLGLTWATNLMEAINDGISSIILLFVYVVVFLVFCYSAFHRRDIQ